MRNAVTKRGLIIPGLNGSGPGHWQTLWEEKFAFERVEQSDWEHPDLALWVETLNRQIIAGADSVILIAHSLGCLTVAHWTKAYPENTRRISFALLVAPPDVERSPYIPEALCRFAAHEPLPFPSLLVGSENDPYMTLEAAQTLARKWRSRFVNAGPVGHVNLDSGHGPWPQGELWLKKLIGTLH